MHYFSIYGLTFILMRKVKIKIVWKNLRYFNFQFLVNHTPWYFMVPGFRKLKLNPGVYSGAV